jgi:hypothetical protein
VSGKQTGAKRSGLAFLDGDGGRLAAPTPSSDTHGRVSIGSIAPQAALRVRGEELAEVLVLTNVKRTGSAEVECLYFAEGAVAKSSQP